MKTFTCDGWLHITVRDIGSVSRVKIVHKEDHVHYNRCRVLPDDVQEILRNAGDKTMSQVRFLHHVMYLWQEILQVHPKPTFSRRTVHNHWAATDRLRWCRDTDQLKSARILLENGRTAGNLGMYAVHPIDMAPEEGFETLAWALPDVMKSWQGRIREVSMDSAWETNGRRFELYALIGEAYGSGLPLGFLLLQNNGGAEGGIQRCLEQFIKHFVDQMPSILYTHTDKNLPEINAFRAVATWTKHQLCFWHALRAVKTRLSILRRQPAHYDVATACSEFSWIQADFLPLRQRDGNAAPLEPVPTALPRIAVRLNGKLVPRPLPSFRIRIPPRGPPSRPIATSRGPSAATSERRGDEDCDDDFEALLEREITTKTDNDDDADEQDEEDGPDWLFEAGESRAPDPEYVFCPAPHRQQLLRLFSKHFVQHPLLPDPDHDGVRSALEIRTRAVHEMYTFCHERKLAEVWAYMWTSWYSAKMWPLWALSASPRIPRLRTTMNVENFWRQLKHDWLHHLLHPRLDQLVYIICNKVLPAYMQRANALEDDYRMGFSRPLTSSQKYFKVAWKKLAARACSERTYNTNVATWQCNCGAQKFSAHLLCKHLVHAVPKPSPEFWLHVYRRRTTPFYQHPDIRPIGQPVGLWPDPDAGCIDDGDDHVWLGNPAELQQDGLWREMAEGRSGEMDAILKRRRSSTASSLCSDSDALSFAYSASEVDGVEPEEAAVQESERTLRLRKKIADIRLVADALEAHVNHSQDVDSHDVDLWLKNMDSNTHIDALCSLAANLRLKEGSARVRPTTWARDGDASQRRFVSDTMGYQVGLLLDDI
ncbi:hypothetical protein EXIGLDRAFT_661315 [Exidia glandulosa HHB12029]|uniref:Uncharacterized protein n=1 Tax=Exidia glandulosa HHB12029 TaxID=1314781 RepID=A0A166NIL3_EXIGL|nr:hypothetical protein EXIGLDRAFT_661315 [Exidia glandulosa HHB12029]